MNLKDLKYLIALSEHRHFGKAAKACFVSQPALSLQIKKLEDTLGVQLLERTNKSVLLTDIGESIVQYAQKILLHSEAIREIAQQAQNPETGDLRLGCLPTLIPSLLPFIFPKLYQYFPNLTPHIQELKSQELIEKLKQGKLDALFATLPLNIPDLTVFPIFEEPLHLAVSVAHPLAKKNHIELADLADQALIFLEGDPCLQKQGRELCQKANLSETHHHVVTLEALTCMTAANLGVALMPAMMDRPNESVVYLPFGQADQPRRTIGMAWRSSSTKSPLLKKIANQIRTLLRAQKPTLKIFSSP